MITHNIPFEEEMSQACLNHHKYMDISAAAKVTKSDMHPYRKGNK